MIWFLLLAQCPGADCASQPAAPAHLTFTGAADLHFSLNGTPFDLPGGRRHLVTPALAGGQVYAYEVTIRRHGALLARRTLEVAAGQHLHVHLPDLLVEPENFGVQSDRLALPGGMTEWLTVNGRPINQDQARSLITTSAQLPDHRHRRRLTVIGPAPVRAPVMARLRGDLGPLAADFVIKDYDPGDWAVARVGFKTDGQPTIYAQEPDGRVLFRLDGPAELERNLQALRRPRPDYRPDADPQRLLPEVASGDGLLAACVVLAAMILLASLSRRSSS